MKHKTLTAIALASICSTALAQPRPAQQEQNPAPTSQKLPEGFDADAKESKYGVYVHTSSTSTDKFVLAVKKEGYKEWSKAAELYQDIIEKYPKDNVPSHTTNNEIDQYHSIVFEVRERLSAWPPEGIDAYRSRYGTIAQALLDRAKMDDVAALEDVCYRYFITDAAKQAGIRLMELYLERGQFAAAADRGEQLLQLYPDLVAEKPFVTYVTALAYHLAGNVEKSSKLAQQLHSEFPDAMAKIRGQEIKLAESLAAELKEPSPVAIASATDSYPTFGGNPERNLIPAASGNVQTLSYSLPYARTAKKVAQRGGVSQLDDNASRAGMTLGIMPVADRGQLFFQDGVRIYGASLESGAWLPGWGEIQGQFNSGIKGNFRRRQLSLTLTDDSILAIMGGRPNRNMIMYGQFQQPQPGTDDVRLVCVNRGNGTLRWSMTPQQLPQELNNISLGGSPLVVGDNVYVLGRGTKGSFEDAHALCFDVHSGKFKWSCYIASASNGMMAMYNMPSTTGDIISHIAYSNGKLYVLTNLGALAALDPYVGSIQWLSIYPRNQQTTVNPNNPFQPQPAKMKPVKPWSYNAVVERNGKLFVLPTDSDFLMVYDAQSGVALKQINLTDAGKQISRVDPNSDEDFDTFLGVWKDWFLVSGDQYVMAINWKTYTGNPNVGLAASPPNMKVRGRGFITSDAVYIPGEERLFKIELSNELERKGLRIVQTYPQSPAPWDDGEDPGNLLVMQDQVVVAGPNRVNVYTDLNVASGKLDKEIAAAPTAVEPRLRYAEVLFIAGQHRKSMEKLDDAVGLLGGMEGMKGGPQRDRIFSDSLNFANKLAADPANNDVELTNALFDRAGAAAKSFSQQVNYRVSRARFADAQKDYALEVKLYQEILLGDKDMRGVFVTLDPANAPEQAAKVAEDAIAAVIKKQGADPYEPFETAAAKALEEAKTANDPAKMLAVAEAYPNAKVAVTSMMAAADSYETQGNVRSALYVLQSVNRKFRASPERPKVIEALARNRLKRAEGAAVNTRIDALAIAGRQLAAAAREFPAATLQKPLILPGGQKLEGMPFAEAAAAVQKLSAEASTAVLPDFGLPAYHDTKQPAPFIPEDPASVIPNVAGMVAPLPGFARYDRIVAWSTTATLGVYEIGKSEPAVSSKALADAPLAHAWVYGELLAWSGKQIAMIDKSGGATWKQDLAALGALEVIGADDTEVVATDDDGDNDGQQVIVQGNRQLILRRGAVVRVMPLPPGGVAAAPVANGPEQIMHIRPIGDRVVGSTSNGRLFAINSADGKLAWQTRLTNRPIDTLLANDDFVVIKMADDYAVQIVVFDAYNGQLVSRRSFPLAQGIVPVNMAMSRDGMLVYTLPDRICGMDLYEGGNALKYQEPQQPPPGQFVYSNAVQSDQLVITDGRILALTEANQTVRILSLETGRELGNKLGTGVQPGTEGHLRAVGNRLYVIGLRTVLGFNVAKPEDHWDGWVPNKSAQDKKLLANIRDAAIGKDFLVVFDQTSVPNVVPGQPAPQQQTNWRLLAYSRSTSEAGSESGKFSYVVPITDPAGILQWQPVDRGFYYLTGDQKLHFLQGAAKKAENK